MDAHGARHQFVIEEVFQFTRSRNPAYMLHLPGFQTAIGAAHLLGGVVVVAGLGAPARKCPGIEGPVRQVDALEGIGGSRLFQAAGCKPAFAVPGTQDVPHLGVVMFERQHALGRDGVAHRLVAHDGR